jgi:uncharacterized protein (TIRG00374 family)
VKKSTILQLCGGVALAGAGLYIFLRDVSLADLWRALRSTPPWAIAGVVALTFLTLWLRSVRWNLILPKSPSTSRRDLFGLVMIGFMINNILPARLGEAARMLLLWKRNRFTVAESVGSVLLERIFDMLVFLSFFFIPALFLAELREWIPYAIPMACGASAALCALLFYAFFPAPSRSLGKFFLKSVPFSLRQKTLRIGKELTSNLDWIFSPGKCLVMIFLSIAMIACHPAMLMLLVRDHSFGVLSGMFAAASAAIGAAIPLSPGYVGTLHAFLKQGFVECGIETNIASAATLIYHAVGFSTVTITGLYYYLRLRISIKEIRRAKEEIDKEESSTTSADKKDVR